VSVSELKDCAGEFTNCKAMSANFSIEAILGLNKKEQSVSEERSHEVCTASGYCGQSSPATPSTCKFCGLSWFLCCNYCVQYQLTVYCISDYITCFNV